MTLSEARLPRSLKAAQFPSRKSFCKHCVVYSKTLLGKSLKRKLHIKATTNKLIFVACSFLIVQVCPTSLGYKI